VPYLPDLIVVNDVVGDHQRYLRFNLEDINLGKR